VGLTSTILGYGEHYLPCHCSVSCIANRANVCGGSRGMSSKETREVTRITGMINGVVETAAQRFRDNLMKFSVRLR
jgi:hypothetical protein